MHPALPPLIDRVRDACQHHRPLRIRGGGSKDFLGHALHGEVLDTTALRGIASYEPTELVVTVAAGTPLAELEAALAEQDQCLPFEPPYLPWSAAAAATTVGGMVAAGLSGPARASVGSVRDHVLGVQMLNGQGQLLRFGGQVIKNVAGYDVSRLMAGAMGTLGLLTEVSLKVLPRAPAQATRVFACTQQRALALLQRWRQQPLPIHASCWVRDTTAAGAPELLFVRLQGAQAAVQAACARLEREAAGQEIAPEQAVRDWALLRDQGLPFFTQGRAGQQLWRLSVPATAPVAPVAPDQLVEWHGALRWLWCAPEEAASVQAWAGSQGGNASLFIAPNAMNTRASGQFDLEPAALAVARRLKERFDPHGIFNPRRLYAAF
ncbi:MAG: glycolate oxidase subunit GlcE [Rhodoferax sp.]